MITVGCAGFAVPATRYFKEYDFVEVQETHRATPGPGTIRRWRREAPPGFEFALVGPRDMGVENFKPGEVIEASLKMLDDVAAQLDSKLAVVIAPAEFTHSRPNKLALKDFLKELKGHFSTIVFELPAWSPDDADSVAEETETIAARDPLHHGLSKRKVAYYRLPGPAGHKSRYEDPAIERLAEIALGAEHERVHYVFTNVDMFADGKRFKRAMGR
ncbi:MAG TPA: DUF72 domain-containing protein [Polyangiaceae bacterium]|jgi:uncharacterized protein YecE (DUF72 family)|nr:DUF72 domain-containing protein [Polyangiaceae bacterium]